MIDHIKTIREALSVFFRIAALGEGKVDLYNEARAALDSLEAELAEKTARAAELEPIVGGQRDYILILEGLQDELTTLRARLAPADSPPFRPQWCSHHNADEPCDICGAPDYTEQRARERLGRRVREEWIAFAKTLPNPKLHWLEPWESLGEPMREVDRRIGDSLYREGYAAAEAHLRSQQPETEEQRAERLLGEWLAVHPNRFLYRNCNTFTLFADGRAFEDWVPESDGKTLVEAVDALAKARDAEGAK